MQTRGTWQGYLGTVEEWTATQPQPSTGTTTGTTGTSDNSSSATAANTTTTTTTTGTSSSSTTSPQDSLVSVAGWRYATRLLRRLLAYNAPPPPAANDADQQASSAAWFAEFVANGATTNPAATHSDLQVDPFSALLNSSSVESDAQLAQNLMCDAMAPAFLRGDCLLTFDWDAVWAALPGAAADVGGPEARDRMTVGAAGGC